MPKAKTGPRAELIRAAKKANAARKRREKKIQAQLKKAKVSSKGDISGPGESAGRTLTNDQTRLEFLAQLRVTPIATKACDAMNIPHSSYTHHFNSDPDFAEAVNEAKIEGWERLEAATFDEAMQPSVPGVNTGKLKEFLLKGRKRHVYGDRLDVQSEHRHEVVVNLIPALPGASVAPLPASGTEEVVEGELVPEIDSRPVSEED